MNVGTTRQRSRVDLHDGPDQHEVPVGTRRGDTVDELDVEALVDDAEEADPRAGNVTLVLRLDRRAPRFREVRNVDAARECMHVEMLLALGLVEGLAAR